MSTRESTSDRPDAAEDLLDDLLEEIAGRVQSGEPVDVEAYADRHPEHADRLRKVVQGLRAVVDLGRSGLAPHPSSEAALEPPEPTPGRLGDFRLIREVGRGGMGVVFEAEQVSLGRRVALKILPLAAAMDPRHLQRFQLEAQAAACLHHTNIVPVYAVGTERGVPFYAMQFIEGRSLAQLLAEMRRLEGLEPADEPQHGPDDPTTSALAASLLGGGLPLREADPRSAVGALAPAPRPEPRTSPPGRSDEPSPGSSLRDQAYIRNVARLGLEAAEAIGHAHTQGILHRDIKPGNLLVDADGQLWITDFGLARVQVGGIVA